MGHILDLEHSGFVKLWISQQPQSMLKVKLIHELKPLAAYGHRVPVLNLPMNCASRRTTNHRLLVSLQIPFYTEHFLPLLRSPIINNCL